MLFASGNFPRVFFKMATSKICNLPCGNFPSLSQPQSSVPYSLFQPKRSCLYSPSQLQRSDLLLVILQIWKVAIREIAFGKLPNTVLDDLLRPIVYTFDLKRVCFKERKCEKFLNLIILFLLRCAEGLHFSEDIGTCVWARESGRVLSMLVYPCLSLCILVYPCLILSIIVYHCLSLSLFGYPCLILSILGYPCLSVSVLVYPFLTMSILVYPCLSLSILIYPCLSLSILSILVYPCLFLYILV